MSDSPRTATNRGARDGTTMPRAVVHKQILNAAASHPDAPMEAIADDVSGANTALVEKVLEEYGDPGRSSDDDEEGEDVNNREDEGEVDDPDGAADAETGRASDDGDDPTDDSTPPSLESPAEPDVEESDITFESDAESDVGYGSDTNESDVGFESDADGQLTTTLEREPAGGDDVEDAADENEDEDHAEDDDREIDHERTSEQREYDDGDARDSRGDANEREPSVTVPDPSSLTEKQLETLRAVAEDPNATQAELADRFGVTSATISQRVNSIDGFDWAERRAITDAMFDRDDTDHADSDTDTSDAAEPDAETVTKAAQTDTETTTRMQTDTETTKTTETETASNSTGTSAPSSADASPPTPESDGTKSNGSGKHVSTAASETHSSASPADVDAHSGSGDRSIEEDGSVEEALEADRSNGTDRDRRSNGTGRSDYRAHVCEELSDQLDALAAQVDRLEERLADREQSAVSSSSSSSPSSASAFADPELAHKVAHASLESDRISEDEELQIFRELVGGEGTGDS